MRYIATASTDAGIVKETNQDSACVKVGTTDDNRAVAMILICDGMGGLSKGELVSGTVVKRFSDWFDKEFPKRLTQLNWDNIGNEWKKTIRELNERILQYGKSIGITLGTTLTAMLIVDDQYMIVHVGDTRAYEIGSQMKQLTEDQTFIAREIAAGRMTEEEARNHRKRNALLQCVGASRVVNPDISFGTMEDDCVYLLCSDGFRHVVSEQEIYEKMNPAVLTDIDIMKANSDELIEIIKRRNERDNITVALLRKVD